MSTISLPSSFDPQSCQLTLRANQRVNASPFGGSEQAVDMLNDRWVMDVDLPESTQDAGAAIEAFIAAMRGQTNVVALYHFARSVPRGTARGTILLNGAVSQGASSIVVDGISPSTGTILAGDVLGVGGQLLMAAADATASGGGATITLVNRVRTALSDNAAVTWNAPTALFRMLSTTGVSYFRARATGPSFTFGEYIA
jgi:hypothetical protein